MANCAAGAMSLRDVNAWLDRLGLANRADDKVETLSKGMSQKVQFIATVIPEPKLLILDEPFTGLDPVSADSIRGAILEMRKRGCTIILSTHDMGVAESLCDSIFMIFRGKKVLDGSLASIQSSYGSDTIRVEVEGGSSMLSRSARHRKNQRSGPGAGACGWRPGCDPQQVLRTLVARTQSHRICRGPAFSARYLCPHRRAPAGGGGRCVESC